MSPDELNAIETDFVASWDNVERFFKIQSVREWLKNAPSLITELRARGYDREFRAGTILWIFVISRARKHGLRDDQPHLDIGWDGAGGMVVTYYEAPNTEIRFTVDRIEVTPELENLLQRLLAHPID